jgi:hypothetical protein
MLYYVEEWIIVVSLVGGVLFGLAAALSPVRRLHLAVSAAVLFLVLGYEIRMDRWEKTVRAPIRLGVCLSIRNSLVSTTRHCGSDQSRPQHVN